MQFYTVTRLNFFSLYKSIIIIVLLLHLKCQAYMVDNNPYRHLEALDPDGNYQLEWFADMEMEQVTFKVTVKTLGFIEFGLSTNGKMIGADIVIGGVRSNGQSYFSDRHAVGSRFTKVDNSQNWLLHSAWENETHTFMSFSRAFDTCDPKDPAITGDRVTLIWAYGEGDDFDNNFHKRGFVNAYLLDPDYAPQIVRDENNNVAEVNGMENSVKVWTIKRELEIPTDDTTYWCSMHTGPNISRKHHIIGFDVTFMDDVSRVHTHHLLIQRCVPPKGRSARGMFEPFLKGEGYSCLIWKAPSSPLPTEYCGEAIHAWGVGGKPHFNPPHVGFPIGLSKDEYYIVQVHYDNPYHLSNIKVELQMDFFYTSQLRPIEGGLLQVRIPSPGETPSILVPPSSINHQLRAHCSPECTQRMFEKTISIYSVLLHSHNSGRKLKLRHFRKNTELPWIMNDNNYGFDYQQFRNPHKEIRIFPGDHLVIECTYDNTWANGTIVGGFSSRQEMCVAFILYHNKIKDYMLCGSDIRSEEDRQHLLGVNKITWNESQFEYIVRTPETLAGLTITEVSDDHVEWNHTRRWELQQFHLSHAHIGMCDREFYVLDDSRNIRKNEDGLLVNVENLAGLVTFPSDIRPYQLQKTCSFTT